MNFTYQEKTYYSRLAKPSDYAFFLEIVKESLFPLLKKYISPSESYVKKSFLRDISHIHILLRGKRRIGFYQVRKEHPNTLYLVKLFLKSSYRRKGLGSVILERLKKGYTKMTLEVWDNNPAIVFYQNQGFVISKKKNHKIFMEKDL